MTRAVIAPSPELVRLAARLEWGMSQYATARGAAASGSRWEAIRHAWTLSNLTLRHAEATALMARTDVAHLPTAWVTARAATESAAKCLWLITPDDEWEREARWVACLEEGARLANRPQLAGFDSLLKNSEALKKFAADVRALLPGGVLVPGIPSADAMLQRIAPELASFYVIASQYTHGAELATQTFRSHLGNAAEFGEHTEEDQWVAPLGNSWNAFRSTAREIAAITETELGEKALLADRRVDEAFRFFCDLHGLDLG
jgi:hypothetical protein